ncbi:MAG: DUF3568 domain-containing protein [Deltaproteobacteria bacterium]|nr:DUF3568 domain-containing protein [Deltaproteobacteria bacterium]
MKKAIMVVCLVLLLPSLGCLSTGVVGEANSNYTLGYMKEDYKINFDQAWKVCERTIAALKGYEVEPSRNIGKGTIKATIITDRVWFYITYKSKDVTEITIRVGITGDKVSSKLIHDQIKEILSEGR